MNIIQGKQIYFVKRTSLNFVNNILSKKPDWKILDIGCGYRANKYATVLADVQNLSKNYKNRKFIKLNEKKVTF